MRTSELHRSTTQKGTEVMKDGCPIRKFICNLCGFKFSKEKYMTNHYNFCKDVENPDDRLGADSPTDKNDHYKEEIQSTELADEHVVSESTFDMKYEEIEFTETTISGPTYEVSGQLIKGVKTETTKEIFKCSRCNYCTEQATYLAEHVKVHEREKLYKQKHAVKTSRKAAKGREKLLKCSRCDYASSYNYHLKAHVRTHTGERPFKCTICEYACSHSPYLKIHMRKHTREKPFKCSKCEYASSHRPYLKIHMRKHTREKPFKCSKCEFVCSHRGGLKIHMRKHTHEKPFKCTFCDYSCSISSSLTVHIRKHTGEKLRNT